MSDDVIGRCARCRRNLTSGHVCADRQGLTLTAELEALRASDPAVAKAAANYDRVVASIIAEPRSPSPVGGVDLDAAEDVAQFLAREVEQDDATTVRSLIAEIRRLRTRETDARREALEWAADQAQDRAHAYAISRSMGEADMREDYPHDLKDWNEGRHHAARDIEARLRAAASEGRNP